MRYHRDHPIPSETKVIAIFFPFFFPSLFLDRIGLLLRLLRIPLRVPRITLVLSYQPISVCCSRTFRNKNPLDSVDRISDDTTIAQIIFPPISGQISSKVRNGIAVESVHAFIPEGIDPSPNETSYDEFERWIEFFLSFSLSFCFRVVDSYRFGNISPRLASSQYPHPMVIVST